MNWVTMQYSYSGAVLNSAEVYILDSSVTAIRSTANYGLRMTTCTGTWDNLTISGVNTGVYCSGATYILQGMTFSDVGYKVNAPTKAYIKQYVMIKVIDEGDPVPGASVEVSRGTVVEYSGETDADGETPWLLLLDRDYVGTAYTGRNTTAQISAFGYIETGEIDTTETGQVLVYELRPEPEAESDGSSWSKRGGGFFDLSTQAWFILAAVVLLGLGLTIWFYQTGKVLAATYSILGTVGGALLVLFLANSWWLAGAGCGIFLGAVAYFALKDNGVDLAQKVRSLRG